MPLHGDSVFRAPAQGQGGTRSPKGRTREWVNTRTGEVQDVPIGIDPGWNHNTGVMGSTQKLNRLAEPALDPGLATG